MATKTKKNRKARLLFFLRSNNVNVWRNSRKAQNEIVAAAIKTAKETEAYQKLEIEKNVAFATMGFTVAIPAILIAVMVSLVALMDWLH